MPAAQAPNSPEAQPESNFVRLHITPFRPDLLKVYLAPSILPSTRNISYHTVATFPEKGFGYVELPEAEAQKIKKKLNGTTLRGSKVRIDMAKPEKRKAREEAEAAKEAEEAERPSKRAKKDKKDKKEKKERKKKEQGVIDGIELPDDRKVKRGWTEPATKPKKDKKVKKDNKDKSDKEAKKERKHSKYTKDPELLFKAKLTPVAATEVAHKDKKKDKKEKKEKNKSKSTEVVVHEFEKNVKTPSFLKQPEVKLSTKPAVDYVNGQGWVDEDGVVVEPETGKAKARRALELVDAPSEAQRAWIDGTSKPSSSEPKAAKDQKKKKPTPPPSSSESDDDESSVVSSSSEDEDSSESESESESEESEAESPAPSPASAAKTRKTQPTPKPAAASAEKTVHPLEALFKRSAPADATTTTPTKKLTRIDTSFSFFDNNNTTNNDDDAMDVDASKSATEEAPITPFTQRDIEWRGLRSAAPTPDTAAIGRRFSFDWRKNSQEIEDDEDMSDVDEDAEHRLTLNTRANASKLAGLAGEEEGGENGDGEGVIGAGAVEDKPESEFRKWFWENRGDLNRAWKKRRRDALKAKRHSENKKMTGGRRVV
ncbi:suppressor protein srp40 protein [Stemphylium lycopersici]|uniref:Suppressor protein srp40 protein n=1 Tax=Stemphylium lycopersici TaxID=183478 RepID=A0A364NCN0_STELY|nr:suppressor protein srp40 protein [Stemphylium lycopersici]RAR15079.1 suppressor protein srp40 protein [Stemphylium lycopersici]